MKEVYILLDYKQNFDSKAYATPYRSGMDKNLLESYFKENGYNPKFLNYSDVNFNTMNFKDKFILISSAEDIGAHYKDYIEDILLGLMYQEAVLLPDFKYFRAHNNKVFMEVLRDISQLDSIKNLSSKYFGTFEEFKKQNFKNTKYVIKSAAGAVGRGVFLSNSKKHLVKIVSKISRSVNFKSELWDIGRFLKHKGYIKESKNRKKFIVQKYVDGLENDWKILVFGNKYYILYRQNRKNDFRASGSGIFEFRNDFPEGILEYAENIFRYFNIPNLSIDVAHDGENFYLIEFQALHFGTTTIQKSPFYFTKDDGHWVQKNNKSILEQEFVLSIIDYINKYPK